MKSLKQSLAALAIILMLALVNMFAVPTTSQAYYAPTICFKCVGCGPLCSECQITQDPADHGNCDESKGPGPVGSCLAYNSCPSGE
jgi:hypothetical protein